MLSEKQRDIVKSTVPLLETGGELLITHFYQIMLDEYPQVRPLFNQAHQASGVQSRALANAVLMYARNIDGLTVPTELVAQIVNKHVALQVQPEHYPIVGTCLLRAIREVLGAEIATDEVIDAWGAAYQQLAEMLITAESANYDAILHARGGWRGERKFTVAKKEKESAEVTSFYFAPVDDRPLYEFKAGQYIGIKLNIKGEEIRRNYSLSEYYNEKYYRISVKREQHGVASGYLHDEIKAGDVISLFPPSGNFTLADNANPVAFITGGIGITPAFAMLQQAMLDNREICFIHYARNKSVHAFSDALTEIKRNYDKINYYYIYENNDSSDPIQPDASGLPSMEHLNLWLKNKNNTEAYFLGPKPFMVFIKKALKSIGIPDERVHYEFFGPAQALE